MARQSSGAKGQPVYLSTGAPSDAADLTEVGQYAADVGNMRIGTTAQRTDSGLVKWDNMGFRDTDLKRVFYWVGGAWVTDKQETLLNATANGGSGTTLQSVTGQVTVPALPFDRVIALAFTALPTAITGGYVNIHLRRDQTTTLRRIRVSTVGTTASGIVFDTIAAGAQAVYTLAAEYAPSGTWTISGDANYTSLQVLDVKPS